MSRFMMFLIFLLVASTVYFFMHYFVYFILATKLHIAVKVLIYIRWVFWMSGISLIVGMLLSRFTAIHFIKIYGYYWAGIISFAFIFCLMGYIFMLIFPAKVKIIGLLAVSVAILTPIVAVINQLRPPKIKTINLTIGKPSLSDSTFTIVQLSDLHISNSTSLGWLKRIVNMTNQLQPDVVVITGDLIEEEIKGDSGLAGIIASLKAVHGVLAITGNHEYYAGIPEFLEFAKKANVKILRNQQITMLDCVDIVGIEDDAGRHMKGLKADMNSAFKKVNSDHLVVFLNHRPTRFDEAIARGTDLQLSGHTHNGQIFPYNFVVSLIYKYSYGLYREGNSYIYTSCGTGLWGPAMRLPGRSEIVKLVIQGGSS